MHFPVTSLEAVIPKTIVYYHFFHVSLRTESYKQDLFEQT